MTVAAALPRLSREVRLNASPAPGTLAPNDFQIVETPLAEPTPDSVLVRNRYFLVFPGLRTLMDDPIDGVPLPALRSGDALFGPAIGEVVAAPGGHALRPGDTVMHMLGWRDYALVPAAGCTLLDDSLPEPVAYLAQGSAAYGAITRYAAIREGDVVFVSGAAGAVGTLAGQIARLLGAGRVIGSTGSPHKAERLVSELGYDQVVLRGTGSFDEQLATAAPDGIDVVVDTVGGEQLRAALGWPGRGRGSPCSARSPDSWGGAALRASHRSRSTRFTSWSRGSPCADTPGPITRRWKASGSSGSAAGCVPATCAFRIR
jgi:NADPH-dependent curcumin reductase CurA